MNQKVGIYARVSADRGDVAIPVQLETCLTYARERGWEVISTYTDDEMSGSATPRPGLTEMLKDAVSGIIDTVLVYHADRLSRDADALTVILALFHRHATVASVSNDLPTPPEWAKTAYPLLDWYLSIAETVG